MSMLKSFLAAILVMVGITVMIVVMMMYPEVFLWLLFTAVILGITTFLTLWFDTYIF
jgi:hypothetical protein